MFLELALQSARQIQTQNLIKCHLKSHILPVSFKLAISMSASNFCVSSILSKSADGVVLKNSSFKSYSFQAGSFINSASQRSNCHSNFSSPKIPAIPKSSISVFPTNCSNFSYSIPSIIKIIDSKLACVPSHSNILSFASS